MKSAADLTLKRALIKRIFLHVFYLIYLFFFFSNFENLSAQCGN